MLRVNKKMVGEIDVYSKQEDGGGIDVYSKQEDGGWD